MRGVYPGAFPWQQQPHTNPPQPTVFWLGFLHLEVARWMTLSTWKQRFVETPLGHITSLKFRQTAERRSLPVAWLESTWNNQKTPLRLEKGETVMLYKTPTFLGVPKKKHIPQKLTKHLLKIKGWFRCKSQMNSSLFKGTFVHFRRGVTWQSHSLASANLPVTVCNNGWKFGLFRFVSHTIHGTDIICLHEFRWFLWFFM